MSNTEESGPVPITPKEAFDILSSNPQANLIDIRSTMEYLMVGHPAGAIHIPWMDEPNWIPNPHFVSRVRELMLGGPLGLDEKNPPTIILICRSGRRSLEAGRALLEAGLVQVFHVETGFEGPLDDSHHRSTLGGWRYENLPWQQC